MVTVSPAEAATPASLFQYARDLLGHTDELSRIEQSGGDLDDLRRYLIDHLRTEAMSREMVEMAARLLLRVDSYRRTQVRDELDMYSGQFEALRSVAHTVASATPEAMARTVTGQLCGSLGYRKAMFSIVNGSSWSPASVSMQPDLSSRFEDLVTAVDGHRIELRDAPREAELVRKRRSYVLDRVDTYRHTYRPLIDLSRPSGYLAVPVVVGGRARAIIHADRHEQGLTDSDLHIVGALAAVCTLAHERAELRSSIGERSALVDRRMAQLARALHDLELAQIDMHGGGRDVDTVAAVPHGDDSSGAGSASLSAREWEVLRRLAAGETNSTISRALCISDGTVKSHVQRIFRKIEVTTRAEAAAYVARRRVHGRGR